MTSNDFFIGLSVGIAFASSMAATFLFSDQMAAVMKKQIRRIRQWNK